MNRETVRRSLLLVFAFVLVFFAPGLARAQRRDFAGSYRISDVSQDGGKVSLTLSLTLHNFSGGEIQNGGVVLLGESTRPPSPVAAFPLIKDFPSYRDVTVSHGFTISAAEYARWAKGENPLLDFLKPDGKGGTVMVPIDLRRVVAGPGARD